MSGIHPTHDCLQPDNTEIPLIHYYQPVSYTHLIHYPDGMIYEPVHSADGQYLGTPVYDGSSVAVSYTHLDVYKRQGYAHGTSATYTPCSRQMIR